MADERTRALERRADAGDAAAAAQLLGLDLRAGRIDRERLRLAAYLGHAGAQALLESDRPMGVSMAREHLLARWWVNGEPWMPGELAELEAFAHEGSGRYVENRRLQVDLDLDPTALGAESGDRIGLQLLHVPRGWSHVGEGMEMMQAMLDHAEPPRTRMSNRIDFVAP